MNPAAAHEHDVPGLGAAKIFLQKNALGIIDVPQPRARVRDGLAQNRVNRTRRRAKRIFDDERLRIFGENFFGFNPVRRDEGFWKRNPELRAQPAREIAFAFNPHRLAGRAENAHAGFHQIFCPTRLRPINGLRNDDVNFFFANQRNRTWKRVARISFAGKRGREMAVVAREIRRDARARVRQRGTDAMRERADAQGHHGDAAGMGFALARHGAVIMNRPGTKTSRRWFG